jgi:poly(hydroxyalkanoate) depolymerase family esterase
MPGTALTRWARADALTGWKRTATNLLCCLGTALLIATGGMSAAAAQTSGAFVEYWDSYANDAGSRQYLVTVPTSVPSHPPLIVYLHGCTQTAPDAKIGTGWSETAAAAGAIVVYPEQSTAADANRCWRWFDGAHQHRGAGEPSIIAEITRQVAARWHADPQRVYVLGASAGGYMSSVMGAAYPDLYAAIGVLAGGAYATGLDLTGAAAYVEMGPRARPMPVFVLQGTADTTNPLLMGQIGVRQWLGTNDLADDGLPNGSVPPLPASTERHAATDQAYAYIEEHYIDAVGHPLVDFWLVEGLGHAYPGGDPRGSFTDPRGPSVTPAALRFFLAHPRP